MRIGLTHLPLACCAMESAAAVWQDFPYAADGLEIEVAREGVGYDLSVLLVAGTITKAGSADVLGVWSSLPEPKVAIAYGVCASSGGPYWDSPEVVAGLPELLPVSRFVPGCPPPASVLRDAVISASRAGV